MNKQIVEIVNLADIILYSENDIRGHIELGISPDNTIHYQKLFADTEYTDGVLTLVNYYGKILLPRHVGINIVNSVKDISGTIASPTNIEGCRSVDLKILSEGHLELCVYANNTLSINKKNIVPYTDGEPYIYGKDFEMYQQIYAQRSRRRAYGLNLYNIDACMQYNLVSISTTGKINLEYHTLIKSHKDNALVYDNNMGIKKLERKLILAVEHEDFILAAKIKKEIERLQKEITILKSTEVQNHVKSASTEHTQDISNTHKPDPEQRKYPF
jgi:hypothetical protein